MSTPPSNLRHTLASNTHLKHHRQFTYLTEQGVNEVTIAVAYYSSPHQ